MNKIKLNKLIAENLNDRQMKEIKGGICYCGCCYTGSGGGSDYWTNGEANANSGLKSSCDGGGYFIPTVTVKP